MLNHREKFSDIEKDTRSKMKPHVISSYRDDMV